MVTICGYLMGSMYAGRLKKREVFLEKMLVLIDNFDELIRYKELNVYELINWTVNSGEYKELTFILSIKPGIKSFDKQWIESIEKSEYKEFLTESDLNEIKSIGIGLGKSDKLGQSSHLKLHKKMLSQKLTEAKQEGTIKGRLYRKVGILTGIAGAIMLM